jgi:RNA polymerase sigma-70 factor (ECF subfamily)
VKAQTIGRPRPTGRPETTVQRSLADDLRERRPEAVDRLLAEHGAEIQAVAQVILRDRDEAADVLEETVIAAWEKASTLRDPAALRPWLLRIATNRALSRRRMTARLVTLDVVAERPAGDPQRAIDARLAITEGLRVLAPRERAAIALHYLADLPVDEVARAMGTSPNTTKTQLREALVKLRREMGEGADAAASTEVRHA